MRICGAFEPVEYRVYKNSEDDPMCLTTMQPQIEDIFPEIIEIADETIREIVVAGWELTADESGVDSVQDVQWAPHNVGDVGEHSLVTHVRDVTALSIALADCLVEIRHGTVNRDYVVAGALLHDVSKVFEYKGDEPTPIRYYLEHPHFSIYLLEKVGTPIPIQHIVLSHTPRSTVPPKTIEAMIVHFADELAVHGIYNEVTGNIKM